MPRGRVKDTKRTKRYRKYLSKGCLGIALASNRSYNLQATSLLQSAKCKSQIANFKLQNYFFSLIFHFALCIFHFALIFPLLSILITPIPFGALNWKTSGLISSLSFTFWMSSVSILFSFGL